MLRNEYKGLKEHGIADSAKAALSKLSEFSMADIEPHMSFHIAKWHEASMAKPKKSKNIPLEVQQLVFSIKNPETLFDLERISIPIFLVQLARHVAQHGNGDKGDLYEVYIRAELASDKAFVPANLSQKTLDGMKRT